MKWFLKRLSEASSHASLGLFASGISGVLYAGVPVSVAVPMIIGGISGFIWPEKS